MYTIIKNTNNLNRIIYITIKTIDIDKEIKRQIKNTYFNYKRNFFRNYKKNKYITNFFNINKLRYISINLKLNYKFENLTNKLETNTLSIISLKIRFKKNNKNRMNFLIEFEIQPKIFLPNLNKIKVVYYNFFNIKKKNKLSLNLVKKKYFQFFKNNEIIKTCISIILVKSLSLKYTFINNFKLTLNSERIIQQIKDIIKYFKKSVLKIIYIKNFYKFLNGNINKNFLKVEIFIKQICKKKLNNIDYEIHKKINLSDKFKHLFFLNKNFKKELFVNEENKKILLESIIKFTKFNTPGTLVKINMKKLTNTNDKKLKILGIKYKKYFQISKKLLYKRSKNRILFILIINEFMKKNCNEFLKKFCIKKNKYEFYKIENFLIYNIIKNTKTIKKFIF